MRTAIAAAVLGCLALAACTHRGGIAENPVIRKFTWFSYLNGDDLRATCREGGPPAYRFVYNGVYLRQVRTYDIAPEPGAEGRFRLTTRIIGPTDVSLVVLEAPRDVFAPGRGTIQTSLIGGDDIAALETALVDGSFYGGAPVGMNLRDLDFFWIGVACSGGVVTFNAYRWPSDRFTAATFPAVLFGWDTTGIPVAQPRPMTRLEVYGSEGEEDRRRASSFLLTVGRNGLVGRGG